MRTIILAVAFVLAATTSWGQEIEVESSYDGEYVGSYSVTILPDEGARFSAKQVGALALLYSVSLNSYAEDPRASLVINGFRKDVINDMLWIGTHTRYYEGDDVYTYGRPKIQLLREMDDSGFGPLVITYKFKAKTKLFAERGVLRMIDLFADETEHLRQLFKRGQRYLVEYYAPEVLQD